LEHIDWENVVKTYSGRVWSCVYRLLGNEADAADCFQETFLSAYRLCCSKKIENIEALLIFISTRRAIDMLRKRISQSKVNGHSEDLQLAAGSNPGPDSEAQNRELASEIRRALCRLPRKEAEAFCLKYMSDYSREQIAQELGTTGNRAGVLIFRAKSRLQKIFDSDNSRYKGEK